MKVKRKKKLSLKPGSPKIYCLQQRCHIILSNFWSNLAPLANHKTKTYWRDLCQTHECQSWSQSGSYWPQMREIWDFISYQFLVHFCSANWVWLLKNKFGLTDPKCTENCSLKVSELSLLPIWPNVDPLWLPMPHQKRL